MRTKRTDEPICTSKQLDLLRHYPFVDENTDSLKQIFKQLAYAIALATPIVRSKPAGGAGDNASTCVLAHAVEQATHTYKELHHTKGSWTWKPDPDNSASAYLPMYSLVPIKGNIDRSKTGDSMRLEEVFNLLYIIWLWHTSSTPDSRQVADHILKIFNSTGLRPYRHIIQHHKLGTVLDEINRFSLIEALENTEIDREHISKLLDYRFLDIPHPANVTLAADTRDLLSSLIDLTDKQAAKHPSIPTAAFDKRLDLPVVFRLLAQKLEELPYAGLRADKPFIRFLIQDASREDQQVIFRHIEPSHLFTCATPRQRTHIQSLFEKTDPVALCITCINNFMTTPNPIEIISREGILITKNVALLLELIANKPMPDSASKKLKRMIMFGIKTRRLMSECFRLTPQLLTQFIINDIITPIEIKKILTELGFTNHQVLLFRDPVAVANILIRKSTHLSWLDTTVLKTGKIDVSIRTIECLGGNNTEGQFTEIIMDIALQFRPTDNYLDTETIKIMTCLLNLGLLSKYFEKLTLSQKSVPITSLGLTLSRENTKTQAKKTVCYLFLLHTLSHIRLGVFEPFLFGFVTEYLHRCPKPLQVAFFSLFDPTELQPFIKGKYINCLALFTVINPSNRLDCLTHLYRESNSFSTLFTMLVDQAVPPPESLTEALALFTIESQCEYVKHIIKHGQHSIYQQPNNTFIFDCLKNNGCLTDKPIEPNRGIRLWEGGLRVLYSESPHVYSGTILAHIVYHLPLNDRVAFITSLPLTSLKASISNTRTSGGILISHLVDAADDPSLLHINAEEPSDISDKLLHIIATSTAYREDTSVTRLAKLKLCLYTIRLTDYLSIRERKGDYTSFFHSPYTPDLAAKRSCVEQLMDEMTGARIKANEGSNSPAFDGTLLTAFTTPFSKKKIDEALAPTGGEITANADTDLNDIDNAAAAAAVAPGPGVWGRLGGAGAPEPIDDGVDIEAVAAALLATTREAPAP